MEIPAGSANRLRLQEAMASTDEEEADVYFTLKTRSARGAEADVAQGHVNLKEMRAAGKEVAAQTVRLNGAEGFEGDAGTLVTVAALDTLAAVAADPAPRRRPRRRAVAAPPRRRRGHAPVRVEVGALKLSAAVHKRRRQLVHLGRGRRARDGGGELAKTRRSESGGGAIDLRSSAMEIPAGRQRQQLGREWIRPTRRPTSTSALKTKSAGGAESDVAQGRMNLRSCKKKDATA